jgi:uncharacterized protein involved in exopolysaccharide biosynthesis
MNAKSTVFVVCVALCAVAISGCGRKKYTATSQLCIAVEEPTVLGRPVQTRSAEEFDVYKQAQRENLTSNRVLMAALRKPEVAGLASVQAETQNGDPVEWLKGIINVELPGRSEIMSVSCTMSDPREAATLTNAVVDAYMIEVVSAQQDGRKRRVSELEHIVSEKEMELRRKHAALKQLTSIRPADDTKAAAAKPEPVDVVILQAEITSLERVLQEVRVEHERERINLHAPPRIFVIEPAEEPLVPDSRFR